MAQWLTNPTRNHEVAGSVPALAQCVAVSCGVGCRRGSDPAWLWLWRRPVATAPIRPLAWEPPYAAGAAQEIATTTTTTKKRTRGPPAFIFLFFCFLGSHLQHMEVPRLGSNRSYSCRPTPQPQQCQIRAVSMTHSTAHGNARSLTH